tara:strand:+ start:623 stop:859 length:237 start_codon:yes stop_codon:yes gene_type:complete
MTKKQEERYDYASEALAVRFERLNVLARSLDDLIDEEAQKAQACGLVRPDRLQSAGAFLLTELKDAEEEYERLCRGEA